MKTQHDLLTDKISELADEILRLEDSLRDNQYLKKELSIARENLDKAQEAISLLDFSIVASQVNANKTTKG